MAEASASSVGQNTSSAEESSILVSPREQPEDVALKEPWKSLTQAAINKIRGHSINSLENLSCEGLSGIESHLFERILSYLAIDNLSPLELKDLFVALTGIIDLRVTTYKDLTSAVPALEEKDPELDQLLKQLSKFLRLGLRTLVLKCDVMLGGLAKKELEGTDAPPQMAIIRLVRYLASIIDEGSQPVSESEVVAVWKECLQILSNGKLKFLSGGHVCRATQTQKRLFITQFKVHEETKSGRKVDLLLRVGNLEVLNTEVKPNDDQSAGDKQYKKNIRINHTTFQTAARRGLELPPMLPLDVRGLCAIVCCIKQASDNILVAGPACSNLIVLPSSKEDLEKFLCGSSPQIFWQYVQ
ncbi:hypothetical protein BGZ54_006960 [Gamsiella multidivaricata]|nr:hypothetical protein BGZ54_006960 [Gamsiella multidivaricata]